MEGESLGCPLLLFFLLFSAVLHANQFPFAFFDPPSGWFLSPSRHFEDGVKIGFVESKKKIFSPSITLSIEKISCSEEEYLKNVKTAHSFDRIKDVRVLGIFETNSGKAHLLQIDTKHPWGDIRMLQALLIKQGYAHIHTAACLKTDFAKIRDQLLKSFQSLRVSFDFFSTVHDNKKLENSFNYLKMAWKDYAESERNHGKGSFRKDLFQKTQWLPFIEVIKKDYADLGICWQILAIEYLKEELVRPTSA